MKLVELLDGCAAHSPQFGSGLSNHLPMALVALHRLGASDTRLVAFAAHYAQRLSPAPAAEPWPPGDAWPPRLGQAEAFAAYRSLFAQWIEAEGAVDLLAQVLPQLVQGVGAAAFHGLIRTAYAARSGHRGELGHALAYWASRHLRLGDLHNPQAGSPQAPAEHDPVVLLRALQAGRSRAASIAARMAEAARDGRVNLVAARLFIDEGSLQRLARAAAFAYAHSGNFTALHLVTGTHAMRVISGFMDEPLVAWAWFWQAFAHATVAARLRPAPEPALLRPWADIVACAIDSDDEHLIKLVDSCREEEKAYARRGETLWRLAASRAVAVTLQGPRAAAGAADRGAD